MSWPFQYWHRLAVRQFQISPSEFWAMPLADWLDLMTPTTKPALDRDRLSQMMKEFPDD